MAKVTFRQRKLTPVLTILHRVWAAACGASCETWRGLRVVLLDGTCVSMPAEDALFEHFGTSGHQRRKGRNGRGRFPLARPE